MLRQKIAVPDRVTGYLDRAGLVERAMPTSRRLTVLQAPGGLAMRFRPEKRFECS